MPTRPNGSAPAGVLPPARPSGAGPRNSLSHPLRIDVVAAGHGGGLIGITFCPGKSGDSIGIHRWERDLEADLDVIQQWGASAVLTLIEDHEFKLLGVPDLGARVRARGIVWHHLPIVDVNPPGSNFEREWQAVGPTLLDGLRRKQRILVHCRGGLGRAGTVAARILVELGEPAGDAIRRVRAARPGAIETEEQRQYVLRLRLGT